ncbi:uncharacterized protein LOC143882153 [Tasmannia lanceolata]|uniref:uncharacterized protein LOC143882153 n=1 Tax=Tasmannia lanceolata TaxID=3420 RepID=UPI004063C7CB
MTNSEEEEEEEECFFESLDRILSSSSASSDNEEEKDYYSMASPVYDVWISEPSSVEERRNRLLLDLGLSGDKTLSRLKSNNTWDSEIGRKRCEKQQKQHNREDRSNHSSNGSNSVVITRSRSSDGVTDSNLRNHHCNSSSFTPSIPIHSIQSDATPTNHTVHDHNHHAHHAVLVSNHGSNNNVASPSKPPSGKLSRRVEEIKPESPNPLNSPVVVVLSSSSINDGTVVVDGDPDLDPSQLCTIKNLDNGKEFVVNELGKDGNWNKLREVETGRQLTREEFEMCVGHSPIVQELMRRQNVEESGGKKDDVQSGGNSATTSKSKKKGGWLKSIRNVASTMTGHRERRSSDEKDTSSDKGGRRSSSATDDSQDVLFHTPERTKVRHYGKSCKELTALYMSQEIQAHNGSIWSIKFSLDGRYLATAGEDCAIHVWQVVESERKGDLLTEKLEDGNSNPFFAVNGSPELTLLSSNMDSHLDKKKRGKASYNKKIMNSDHVVIPENVFALTEKPICSFQGHLADVLDLSWSESQYLLSSSMDKTVRLWHMSSNSCLKTFSHSDFVTCIQFNPVDDRYFISGSLDAKVRIWSIPDRYVVHWNDLHEMVTAVCYTPDGQGALVGSHKGSCCLYNTTDNKLHQKNQINLQNKKKSHVKKITGFQFAPGSSSEVLVTSADSRVRVIDGVDLVHKFKGFRNTSSQISASLTTNGKYVVCASEDSHVYVWRYDGDSRPTSRSKGITITRSYEHFHCRDVSVAIPWPGIRTLSLQDTCNRNPNEISTADLLATSVDEVNGHEGSPLTYGCSGGSPFQSGTLPNSNSNYLSDRVLGGTSWPEEKMLLASEKRVSQGNGIFCSGRSAWGMVIVTAGLGGEIRIFQNFGLPVRI